MKRRTAFTLIELLIIVAIILILVALMFPVFSGMRERNRQFVCLSNMRQLGISWLAFSGEHNGQVVGAENSSPYDWIYKTGANTAANSTNWITGGALYPYVGSVKSYQCPSDKSGHVCGYALVARVGGYNSAEIANPQFGKHYALEIPNFAVQALLVEENDPQPSALILNMGAFWLNSGGGGYPAWTGAKDYPAWNRHRRKWMNVVFCDGHGEMWSASDPTSLVITNVGNTVVGTNPDNVRFYKAYKPQ